MSRAVGKHFGTIRKQREILREWADYEQHLERGFDTYESIICFWNFHYIRGGELGCTHFPEMVDWYHAQLDAAERRLKIAASIGATVDISDTPVGHDIRCVCEPVRAAANLGNKQRARDNLLAWDFYERCGRTTQGTHASKLTMPIIAAPDVSMSDRELADAFVQAEFPTIVVGSFENTADAMVYRLAVRY